MKQQLTKLDHVTLAEGEVTGHSHQAMGGVLFADDAGNFVLQHTKETEIRHEEHHAFKLPAVEGEMFDVRIVQEFDHAAVAARNVAD